MKEQEVANTLWAYATMWREPDAGVMMVREGRAQAVAGTFTAQGVANTLCAYATMERMPGAGLMRLLEGGAEAVAGTFNTQKASNTLWAVRVISVLGVPDQESRWVHVAQVV